MASQPWQVYQGEVSRWHVCKIIRRQSVLFFKLRNSFNAHVTSIELKTGPFFSAPSDPTCMIHTFPLQPNAKETAVCKMWAVALNNVSVSRCTTEILNNGLHSTKMQRMMQKRLPDSYVCLHMHLWRREQLDEEWEMKDICVCVCVQIHVSGLYWILIL